MPVMPITPPPGITKQATEYSNKGRWTDGNLVRWANGKLQPVGGWIKVKDIAVTDPDTAPVRTLFSWVDKATAPYTAMGSNDKLFVYYGIDPNDEVVDITPTDLGVVPVTGYGYGSSTYGTGRYGIRVGAPVQIQEHSIWAMDNYGEDLLAVHSGDGRILRWNRTVDPLTAAAPLANAPTGCTAVIVAEERHVIALGADGDKRRVEWSDRENPTEWTPTATNQAGGINLQTTGSIVGAVHVRGGILILTTTDAHLMRFTGGNLVYRIDHAGHNCGAFSAQTLVDAFDVAVWMGQDRFWIYDGAVKPLECEVLEHVYQRMNKGRPFAFSAGASTPFNEIWFHYPTSGDLNPTEYVAFSYRDQPHWHIGKIARTAWHDNMIYNYPLAVDPAGALYFHEFGWLDNATPRLSAVYAETAPYDIASGEHTSRVRRLFQDAFDPNGGPYPYEVELKMQPGADGAESVIGPLAIDNQRGYTDARGHGRQVQLKVISTEDAFWELGTMRVDYTKGGRRT